MRAHLLVVGLAGFSFAAAAFAAEQAKVPVQKAEQPAGQTAPALIAAASQAPSGEAAAEPQAAPPAKKRRGRVTSCRCGDQNPSD